MGFQFLELGLCGDVADPNGPAGVDLLLGALALAFAIVPFQELVPHTAWTAVAGTAVPALATTPAFAAAKTAIPAFTAAPTLALALTIVAIALALAVLAIPKLGHTRAEALLCNIPTLRHGWKWSGGFSRRIQMLLHTISCSLILI